MAGGGEGTAANVAAEENECAVVVRVAAAAPVLVGMGWRRQPLLLLLLQRCTKSGKKPGIPEFQTPFRTSGSSIRNSRSAGFKVRNSRKSPECI